jgi:hypothetical protein
MLIYTTGPFVGGEVLDHPFTVRPKASLYALGVIDLLSQVVVLTVRLYINSSTYFIKL